MNLWRGICAFSSLYLASLGCTAAPVQDAVPNRFTAAALRGQKIGGVLGERMRVNLEQRLLRVDQKGLLDGFRSRPGSHAWIGEHIGKFFHAAANAWLYSGDPRLRAQMDAMFAEWIATQLPDGYLGTYTNDRRWTSWDVWVHKYDLIGLLSYYDATGSPEALGAAVKVGDLMVRTFGDAPGQIDIVKTGDHVGMASTSILEPMCQLYRHTGDARYLSFAKYIVAAWDHPGGPGVLKTLQETNSVVKTANAKGYELLSNLVGLLELYRLTGEAQYLSVVQAAWNDIVAHRLYITGTTTSKEYFRDDFRLPASESAEVGEGCVTVTWLQMNWHLMQLTGEPKFADEIEKTVYNHLLAAQDPNNGNVCYFTPLVGTKHPGPGISCCVSSVPRGISMIPQFAWGEKDGGAAILLYVPGEVTLSGMKITSETDFPASGKTALRISAAPDKSVPMYLRVPAWTTSFLATAAGKTYRGRAGQFLRIDRTWKAGDTVQIAMDMTAQRIDGGPEYPGHIALRRGPQVLSLDPAQNPDVRYLFRSAPLSDTVEPGGRGAYSVPGETVDASLQRKRAKLTFVPYMDASDPFVWVKSPASLSTKPVAVTAFAKERWSRNGKEGGSITDERADTYGTTDKRDTPAKDFFAVELKKPAVVNRLVYLHGKSSDTGGWFQETPVLEVQRTAGGPWVAVGEVPGYRGGPELKPGQAFELKLPQAIEIVSVRVIGKAHNYASCAELAAYRD